MKLHGFMLLGSLCAVLLLVGGCDTTVDSEVEPTDVSTRDTGEDTDDGDADALDAEPGFDASPVECGSMTCSPDEYCVVQKCCGADPGFNDAGEWQGSDSYRCVDVPDECNPNKPCECDRDWCNYQMPQCEGRTIICPTI